MARELERFSSWRSVVCSVRLWGVIQVAECVELICRSGQNDCRECMLSSEVDFRGVEDMVSEVWRFPHGVFPTSKTFTLEIVQLPLKKKNVSF